MTLALSVFALMCMACYLNLLSFLAARYGGRFAYYSIHFIGVVVHESAHYIACRLFGHRVKEVALFKPRAGSMGYVTHQFKHFSPRAVIGCFFVGFAPLLSGLILQFWIFNRLEVHLYIAPFPLVSIMDLGEALFEAIREVRVKPVGLTWQSGLVWLFSASVTLSMVPSNADLRGSVPGVIAIAVILLLVPVSWHSRYMDRTQGLLGVMLICTIAATSLVTATLFLSGLCRLCPTRK